MVQMEQALAPYMTDKSLGLPYWDWSSSEGANGIYPAFPDLWKDIRVGVKESRHSSFDEAFGEDTGNFAYGSHCRSDRFSQIVARITDDELLHENFETLNSNINTLARDLDDAMTERNIIRFCDRVSRIHGHIHVGFACRLYGLEQTAYDPMFYLHHSFVEKIFVDWQKRNPSLPSILSRTRIQEPFNDRRFNKYAEFTRITDRQSWDYERNLCYCYDCDLPNVPSTRYIDFQICYSVHFIKSCPLISRQNYLSGSNSRVFNKGTYLFYYSHL